MLQKLIIRNYAIIDHLTLEPVKGLNIVTGETGAGKSIIIGALSLILGERADPTVLINKDEKCVIEAHFYVNNNEAFQAAIAEEELDNDATCIIRREIATNGKSRAFVNDTPVNLATLNRLTTTLVDLHQQFGHLELENNNFQMDVLDAIAQNGALRKNYNTLFQHHKKISQQLAEQQHLQASWQKDADYKQYLLDELTQASFKENEIEEAEMQLKQMNNAERIMTVLQACHFALEEGEQPVVNELKKIVQQLQSIADVMPQTGSVQERILSTYAELKDVAGELEQLQDKVWLDQELMEQLQQRIDLGYKLLKKHGYRSTNELIAYQRQLERELKDSLNLNEAIEVLTKELTTIHANLMAEGNKLSIARQKAIPDFAAKINELLALVGMPNARFKIEIHDMATPAPYGIDEIAFLLDANKSGQFLPIYKAASGGEMSRMMLCIKSLTAKAVHLPTLIFDEVDTGISGEAARQVSLLLHDLGNYHQVICITHQPQVAARGEAHFYVYKDEGANGRITTKVRMLQKDEKILAIARMIGGERPSEAAMQNARELMAPQPV